MIKKLNVYITSGVITAGLMCGGLGRMFYFTNDYQTPVYAYEVITNGSSITSNHNETTSESEGDIVVIESGSVEDNTSVGNLFDDLTTPGSTSSHNKPNITTTKQDSSIITTNQTGTNVTTTKNNVQVSTTTKANQNTTNNQVNASDKKPKIGWQSINGKKYFYINNKKSLGWKKIAGKYYFFKSNGSNKGSLVTNKIVGAKKGGYYYVDKKGIRVTNTTIKKAVSFVRKNTRDSWKNETKLKKCFTVMSKSYKSSKAKRKVKAKNMASFATDIFNKKTGDSTSCAAAMCYIAKTLGYESRLVSGKIPSIYGGLEIHSWAEIKMNGKWYIFDVNLQQDNTETSYYKLTDKKYVPRHRTIKRYYLKISNGKVSWK